MVNIPFLYPLTCSMYLVLDIIHNRGLAKFNYSSSDHKGIQISKNVKKEKPFYIKFL